MSLPGACVSMTSNVVVVAPDASSMSHGSTSTFSDSRSTTSTLPMFSPPQSATPAPMTACRYAVIDAGDGYMRRIIGRRPGDGVWRQRRDRLVVAVDLALLRRAG